MHTTTSHVRDTLSAVQVGDVSALVSLLTSRGLTISVRHANRVLGQVFAADRLTSFEQVRAGDGSNPNPLVFQAFDGLARKKRLKLFFAQIATVENRNYILFSDRRGAVTWSSLEGLTPGALRESLERLAGFLNKKCFIVPHRELQHHLYGLEIDDRITVADYGHPPLAFRPSAPILSQSAAGHKHLDNLEAESIRIIREAIAVAQRPAMLFSMGKDSMVMWELSKKAFWPEPPPFPLIVIDTRWKFQDMYRFREYMAALPETDLRVHINPDAIAHDVNPFDFGSAKHTEITKTQALKQILDQNQFDFVFGGARRDEEKSRAKERVFSVRNERHGWDPKAQRPELWNLYNTFLPKGHSMRVFPLSNWTELDVWRYIEREDIPVVPLYFSKVRPFVEREGALIMVDDERFPLEDGERIHFEPIRFRTLGCYPLTGGVRSNASTLAEIIEELENSRVSERSSRVIDFDPGASMEQKKKDGYF